MLGQEEDLSLSIEWWSLCCGSFSSFRDSRIALLPTGWRELRCGKVFELLHLRQLRLRFRLELAQCDILPSKKRYLIFLTKAPPPVLWKWISGGLYCGAAWNGAGTVFTIMSHCRKTREMAEKMVGAYNMWFWHPEGRSTLIQYAF